MREYEGRAVRAAQKEEGVGSRKYHTADSWEAERALKTQQTER